MRRRKPDAAPADLSPARLRATALRLLGRRDYTAAELRQKLADRGFAADDIDACLIDPVESTTNWQAHGKRFAEA